jgi:hypothetical protein
VVASFDPGALLSRSYELPRGPRVRLRMARTRDEASIRALLAQHGLEPSDLELGRLVRFDPRNRIVICATALIGSRETVVGLGAIDLDDDRLRDPDTLVVDERLTDGLGDLLVAALTGRANAIARTRAA